MSSPINSCIYSVDIYSSLTQKNIVCLEAVDINSTVNTESDNSCFSEMWTMCHRRTEELLQMGKLRGFLGGDRLAQALKIGRNRRENASKRAHPFQKFNLKL